MPTLTSDLPARRRAAVGLAVAALVTLTACGQEAAAPAPTAASAPVAAGAGFSLEAPALDLGLVPGAAVAADEGTSPAHHGEWLDVPGAPVWTSAMSAAVKDQIAAYRRDTDVAAAPRLDVRTQLAVAGQDVAAARLVGTQTRGAESVAAVETIWYSPREDRVLTARELFTADGWDAFRAEVRDRMARDPEVLQERVASAASAPDQPENRRVWDGVVFLPDGSALLEVDQSALAPGAAGVLTARIPAATVQPWLSALGRTAQSAARVPTPVRLPGPAPAATTAPAAPASSGRAPSAGPSSAAPSPSAATTPAGSATTGRTTAPPAATDAPISAPPTSAAPTSATPSSTAPGTSRPRGTGTTPATPSGPTSPSGTASPTASSSASATPTTGRGSTPATPTAAPVTD